MASETTKDGIAVVVVTDDEELLPPEPMPGLHGTALPPFLPKTFEMVEDTEIDDIISWGMERNSFIVWDPYRLSSDLLPRYFKHGNFSSFVRQLNTYGFRKVFPDRWEFAHEKFLGGQKHLLKEIKRRRNGGQSSQQKVGAGGSTDQSPGTGSCVELGQFGFEAELDRLKRDRNILMAEIVNLKNQQQISRTQILAIEERIQGTDRMQQRTTAFLARAFKNPSFIEQLQLQCDRKKQQFESTGRKRKRRLTATASSENLQLDGVDIGANMANLLSTVSKDGGTSSRDEKVEAVLETGGQDFGVISDVFLEEYLDIGIGEGDQREVEVEDLAAYQYDWVDVKEMVDELGYLLSEP